jgi:uracil-DNA glycosylase family 4
MSDPIKQRVKLWLRSDQAMGLSAEPVVLEDVPAAARQVAAPAPAPPVLRPPQARTAPAIQPRPVPPPRTAVAPPADAFFDENAPFTSPVPARDEKTRLLAELDAGSVKSCRKCRLCEQRSNTVFGEGDVDASLMFIGEGPGADEDAQGRPFVGRAGQKLNEMIAAMGLRREQVYIGNVVKCRPPDNRTPIPDEMDICFPYLLRQIEIIRPRVIVLLGLTASKAVLHTSATMSSMRGRWHNFRGIKVMPTFHPSYILRNYTPETRRAVWNDLQLVMAELGIAAPKSRAGAE